MKVISRKTFVLIVAMTLLIYQGIVYAERPMFNELSKEISLSENTPIGTEVARFSVTNPSGVPLSFSSIAGMGDFSFSGEGNEGVVKVSDTLDYETCSSYCIKLFVKDATGDWSVSSHIAFLMITILDEAEGGGVQGQSTENQRNDGGSTENQRNDGGSTENQRNDGGSTENQRNDGGSTENQEIHGQSTLISPPDPISQQQSAEPQGNTDSNQQGSEVVQRDNGQQLPGVPINTSTEQKTEVVQQSSGQVVRRKTPTIVYDRVATPGQVSFSELMITSKGGLRSSPQWIELYNNSSTTAVNLRGWQLEIESRDTDGAHRYAVVELEDLRILAGQTALMVTSRGRNSIDLPSDRVYSFFTRHYDDFDQTTHRNAVLGQVGFFLKLSNPYGGVIDVAGNLDGDGETTDEPLWELPSGETEDGARTSLQRQYEKGTNLPLDGTDITNWIPSSDLGLSVMTYWGEPTDVGNPGYKGIAPLVFDSVNAPGQVGFSELMITSKGGIHSSPQWIELYNNSSTTAVNLRGWQLEVESRDINGAHRHTVVKLEDLHIPTGQTALMVTSRGRNSIDLPSDRVYSFFTRHYDDFDQTTHRNAVLGQVGFFLKLSNSKGVIMDVAGNLDGDPSTTDEPLWELPSGETEDGARTSLQRRYEKGTNLQLDGTDGTNWVPSSELELSVMTYWGASTDVGNPGYRVAGDLPLKIISDVGSAPSNIPQVPKESTLFSNYPNPFNPETWIPYHLAKASNVQITIYDVRGMVVRRLELGHQREGYYTSKSRAAYWDGRNSVGERVSSGIYFYQFQTDNVSLLRKMLVLK